MPANFSEEPPFDVGADLVLMPVLDEILVEVAVEKGDVGAELIWLMTEQPAVERCGEVIRGGGRDMM